MRETCKGCVHYRSLCASGNTAKCCHYILDMNTARETPADECRNNGKYVHRNSKEGKKIMARRTDETWDRSVKLLVDGYKLRKESVWE